MALPSVAPSFSDGPAASGPVHDRGDIIVAPPGANLMSILDPFMYPPENGGYGLGLTSRYLGDTRRPSSYLAGAAPSLPPLVWLLALGAVAWWGVRRG